MFVAAAEVEKPYVGALVCLQVGLDAALDWTAMEIVNTSSRSTVLSLAHPDTC